MKEDELRHLRKDLRAALDRLDDLIGSREDAGAPDISHDVTAMPRTKAIEWALSRQPTPMRPVQIWKTLRELGRNDPKSEIQVTTYDLWQRNRIERVERGLYRAISGADLSADEHSYEADPNTDRRWTTDGLKSELMQFERDLRSANLAESSVHTYVDRTQRFIKWLDGEYRPRKAG